MNHLSMKMSADEFGGEPVAREGAEYRRGRAKLAAWHRECAERRAGKRPHPQSVERIASQVRHVSQRSLMLEKRENKRKAQEVAR